jgi:iron complex outermembrane recepter protein
MTGFIHSARRLIVVLAALSIIGAGEAAAQQTPAGAYRSPNASLRLTADGNATVSGENGPLSITSYHITGDTLSLRDERASAVCSEEPGLYLWRIAADTLRLQVLTDRCEGRRAALATEWTRLIGALTAVVITAERQAQDLQRSALAVSVVSGEETRDANVTRPQDLTNLVPGLMIGAINGTSALTYLRGVGNAAATSLQDPAVTFNFDGVYIAHPTSTGGLYYDLERVEVVKGPQGTLYGRNATGGAINILPRHPQLREQDGELSAEYGNHNGQQFTGWYNMPLGDRAAVRVAGQRVAHDSYMKDGTDDQDDRAGRVAFRFDPTDALRLHLGADYYEQRGHGPGSTPLAIGTETRDGITSPAGGAYLETQTVTITHRDFLPLPSQQRANNRHRGVNATLDWDTALGALTIIPAARGSDLDATGTATATLYTFDEHSTQTTLEAHLASNPNSRVHLLTGGFFFRENGDLYTRPYNEFNFSMQHPSFSTTSVAPFGRVTFDVTHKLHATLGARYTHEDKHFGGTFQAFSRICPTASCPNAQPFPVGIATAPITFPADSTNATPVPTGDGTLTVGSRVTSKDSATYSRTTWRAAAEYDLSNQALLYSSYETGFKSGGFFFSDDAGIFQPESIGAFTIGLKSRLLSYRLNANVELFDWLYKNQQVSRIVVDSKNVSILRTDNVGRESSRGVEADVEYLLFANTHVSANVQYLDAVEKSYVYLGAPALTGCPRTPTSGGAFTVDCSGRQSPYAPRWTAGLGASHALELADGARLLIDTRARYQSKTLMGTDFLAQQEQSAYWVVDASLAINTAGDRYSIGVFGQNLTDRTILSNTWVMPFSSFAVGALRPPRTIGLRAGARF